MLQRFLDPSVLASISSLDLLARTVVDGFVAGLHSDVHHAFDAAGIHDAQHVNRVESVQVVVVINRREPRTLHVMFLVHEC